MIASKEFKPFVGTKQTALPDSRSLKPEILFAIAKVRKASLELSDKLYVLENLLEDVTD